MNYVSRFVRFAGIALIGTLAPAAHAQTVATPYSWSSLLDNSSPFFDRYGGGSDVFYYSALTFIPDTTGIYTLETTAALFQPSNWSDTYIHLYQGGFDPLNPFVNLVAQDDDGSIDNLSLTTVALDAGSSYTYVVTTYSPGDTGSVTSQISGPGGSNITLAGGSPAPEPGSLALLGLVSLPAIGLIRRRR